MAKFGAENQRLSMHRRLLFRHRRFHTPSQPLHCYALRPIHERKATSLMSLQQRHADSYIVLVGETLPNTTSRMPGHLCNL